MAVVWAARWPSLPVAVSQQCRRRGCRKPGECFGESTGGVCEEWGADGRSLKPGFGHHAVSHAGAQLSGVTWLWGHWGTRSSW